MISSQLIFLILSKNFLCFYSQNKEKSTESDSISNTDFAVETVTRENDYLLEKQGGSGEKNLVSFNIERRRGGEQGERGITIKRRVPRKKKGGELLPWRKLKRRTTLNFERWHFSLRTVTYYHNTRRGIRLKALLFFFSSFFLHCFHLRMMKAEQERRGGEKHITPTLPIASWETEAS